jgi:hypothetical protein
MLMDLVYAAVVVGAFAGYCLYRHAEESRQLRALRHHDTDTPRTLAAIAEDSHRVHHVAALRPPEPSRSRGRMLS